MIVHAISDISKREKNQDNYWYARFNVTTETTTEEALVACVCDGMGGLEDGEKASRVVIEKVRKFFIDGRPLSSIADILKEAHEDIRGFSDKRSGTTCVILVCLGGKYRVVIKTSKKKLKQKKAEVSKWLHDRMHNDIFKTLEKIKLKVMGHYAYYGINGNFDDLNKYYKYIKYKFYKVLTRRGQKHAIPYKRYLEYWNFAAIPKPIILVNIW